MESESSFAEAACRIFEELSQQHGKSEVEEFIQIKANSKAEEELCRRFDFKRLSLKHVFCYREEKLINSKENGIEIDLRMNYSASN
jgi:hypothetical protein